VISLALNFDHLGPVEAKSKDPAMGRTDPLHIMLRTGTDAYSEVFDSRGIRPADDMLSGLRFTSKSFGSIVRTVRGTSLPAYHAGCPLGTSILTA
jgi:hypothetical protein